MRKLVYCIAMGIMSGGIASANSGADTVKRSGINGGLIVHLGCGDGRRTAELRVNDSFVVHGLDADGSKIEAARRAVFAKGDSGNVSFMQLAGDRLPYADNLVNLLVVEDGGRIPKDELMRVLAPLGGLLVRKDGKWVRYVKPWPNEIDQWTLSPRKIPSAPCGRLTARRSRPWPDCVGTSAEPSSGRSQPDADRKGPGSGMGAGSFARQEQNGPPPYRYAATR